MENLEKVLEPYIQLEYVMGKKPCPRLKGISVQLLPFLEAYGKFFKAIEAAQETLHKDLKRLLKELPKNSEE